MKKIIALMLTLMLCAFAFVACQQEPAGNGLDAAGDYLFSLYKDDKAVTPSDYDVVGLIKIGDVTYNVEWSVNADGITVKESSKAGFFTIDVDEKTATEINYTLTATVKAADGSSVQKTFDRTVPAYKLMSYAEYAAAADDTTVAVKGIIVGIFSKSNGSSANGLYLQDENGEGGYYVSTSALETIIENCNKFFNQEDIAKPKY